MAAEKEQTGNLRERARTAQREHRWSDAEAAYRELLASGPTDRVSRAGLGTVLLAQGRMEEARDTAQALLREAPNEVGSLTLAARVASAQEDWKAAESHWRAVLAINPDAHPALAGIGAVLIGSGDIPGAEAWAAALHQRFPGDPMVAALLVRIGTASFQRAPNADHTDFWKRARDLFPTNMMFVRRQALYALKSGRHEDAIAAIDALLASGEASVADAGLVVGIAQVYAARDDQARLRATVRRYLRGLRGKPDRRLAALRLSRIIFAYFTLHNRAPRVNYRERAKRWLARAPLEPSPQSLLARSLALEVRLAGEAPAFLDTDVSRAECLAFVARVRECVAKKNPFSFVRVNDGEANALPYEPEFAAHFDADAGERETVWWGRECSIAERRAMTAKIAEAIWNADAIGVPTFGRILRDVRLLEDDDFTHRRTGRGLVAGVAAFERWRALRPAGLPPPLFLSANLQQDLQRWHVYGDLFDGIGEIVLVSGHRDLPDAMKAQFGVDIAAFVPVPAGDASLHLRSDARLLPDVLDDVVARVEAEATGRAVIVGAGYLGKWIVHRARAAGGIALDLGSALDYWAGFKTRSYQDLA